MTTEFSGSACVVSWIWSGGTVTLEGDYRKLSIKPSGKTWTGTAGSDSREKRYPGVGDASIDFDLVAQTGGTAVRAALAFGVQGTIIVGPEGTATGKPKTTMSGISQGLQEDYGYDNESQLKCTVIGDGVTWTVGAY